MDRNKIYFSETSINQYMIFYEASHWTIFKNKHLETKTREFTFIFIHLFLHELVESTESSYVQNTQLRTENKLWLFIIIKYIYNIDFLTK